MLQFVIDALSDVAQARNDGIINDCIFSLSACLSQILEHSRQHNRMPFLYCFHADERSNLVNSKLDNVSLVRTVRCV